MGEAAKQLDKLLRAEEVAELLNVTIDTAYEVMRECQHVRIGRLIRVKQSVIEKWINKGGNTWRRCTDGEEFGGAGDTVQTANDGAPRPTSETTQRLKSLREKSSSKRRLRTIRVRENPSPSKKR